MTLYFHTLFAVLYLIGFACVPASFAGDGTSEGASQPLFTLAPNVKEGMRAWRAMVQPEKIIVTHRVTCYDAEAARAVAQTFHRGGAVRAWTLIGIVTWRSTSFTWKSSMGSCSVESLKKPESIKRVGVSTGKSWHRGVRYTSFSVLVPDFPRELEGGAEPRGH